MKKEETDHGTAIEDQTDAALSGIERDAFFQELLQEIHEFQDFSLILDDLERHPVFRRHGELFNEEDFREFARRLKNCCFMN